MPKGIHTVDLAVSSSWWNGFQPRLSDAGSVQNISNRASKARLRMTIALQTAPTM